MKILHVITSLLTGGAEKLMVDLLPRIKAQGHDVELCSFDNTVTPFRQALENAGVKIHSFHKGVNKVYDPRNIWRLRRLIKRGQYDIVHTHNYAPQIFAPIAKIMLRGSRGSKPLCGGSKQQSCGSSGSMSQGSVQGSKPYLVTTEHNTNNRRRGLVLLKSVDKWMYNRYASIICISEQAATNLIDYLPKTKNVSVIFNGIDCSKFANAPKASDVRLIGERIVTMVAAFRPQKDQPTLIKAMKYLPEDFHLCLVGSGDDERKDMFENLAEREGVKDRVHLLGLRNDIPNVLAASDYVVMSSHYEGLSLSNLEGMAAGKPFIASDVEGLREVTKGYGVLFPHEDSKALAEEIMKLENEELRNEVAARCMERAKMFDIEKMVEGYARVYAEISE